MSNQSSNQQRCLYCGHPADIIWVHGHGQCANCGINTDECCRGESCLSDSTMLNAEDSKER